MTTISTQNEESILFLTKYVFFSEKMPPQPGVVLDLVTFLCKIDWSFLEREKDIFLSGFSTFVTNCN